MSTFSVSGVLQNNPHFNIADLSESDGAMVRKFIDSKIADFPVPLEQIKFLMTNGLSYSISFYMNSTDRGEALHKLKKADNGDVLMCFEGRFIPVAQVMTMVKFNEAKERFVSSNNENEDWNYISPDGFVQRSSFHYNYLYPIEEIGQEEYTKLLAHANNFWNENQPEVDPGVEKKCVLQVVTTNRQHSNDNFMNSLLQAYPEHATFRLFTPDGKVYSFGFQMEPDETGEIFNESFPFTFAKTTTTQISTPDYEEARPFHLKRVTSIPITEERLQAVIELIEDNNRNGLTFNFFRQNCATLAREVLKTSGLEVKVRVSLGEGLSMASPKLEDYPYVGPTLSTIANQISTVSTKIFDAVDYVTPFFVRYTLAFIAKPFVIVVEAVQYVASKIVTVVQNLVVMKIGGSDRSDKAPLPGDGYDNLDNQNGFTSFSRLVRSWYDILNENLFSGDVHLCLIDWQLKQATTCIHRPDEKIKMHYLPAN